jgi:hypothetical protein
MKHRVTSSITREDRIRSALLVIAATALFLFGLLLLFAPGPPASQQSLFPSIHFLCGSDGRIIGSQSRNPVSLAGG